MQKFSSPSPSSSSLSLSFSSSLLLIFLFLALPLFAEEKTAVMNCETLLISSGNTVADTNDENIKWNFRDAISASNQYKRDESNKKCLYIDTGIEGDGNKLTASYVGGQTTDIPNIRSFSFLAKTLDPPVGEKSLLKFEVSYRVNGLGLWQTTGITCSPDLSALSTEWQTFTFSLREDYFTAELMISVHTGHSVVLLLDDLTITYDPDYVAPSPEPTPNPCANCFSVTF